MIRWAMVELRAGQMPKFPSGVQGRRSQALDAGTAMLELEIPSDELLEQIEAMPEVNLYPHLAVEGNKIANRARLRLGEKGGQPIRAGAKVHEVLADFFQQKGLRFEP